MPCIPLKHKCLSIILIWFIVSHIKVEVVSKKSKKKKKNIFFLLFLIGKKQTWYWGKRRLFWIGNVVEIQLLEKGRKSPGQFCYPLYPNTSDTPYICQDKENVA